MESEEHSRIDAVAISIAVTVMLMFSACIIGIIKTWTMIDANDYINHKENYNIVYTICEGDTIRAEVVKR